MNPPVVSDKGRKWDWLLWDQLSACSCLLSFPPTGRSGACEQAAPVLRPSLPDEQPENKEDKVALKFGINWHLGDFWSPCVACLRANL